MERNQEQRERQNRLIAGVSNRPRGETPWRLDEKVGLALSTVEGSFHQGQKILGHSSLEVVRMYVNLASEDVQIQHRRFSPVPLP